MQASNDYVIVKRKAQRKSTKGGILIPETNAKPNYEFEVVSVGPKVTEVVVGDFIILNIMNAQATIIDDTELFFVRQDDVVAKV